MQGRGLLKGTLPDAMGRRISGRSNDLDALAVYTNSHGFTISPHSKDGLSSSALRGRKLFESARTKCTDCHSGPFYSDSHPAAAEKLTRHNVGTGESDKTELMGPEYDTPTLLGLYRSAPYLHHGKAKTLHDVLTSQNLGDRHGVTSHLSSGEIDDMVEFLKALPFEDPEAAAQSMRIQKISK